MAATQADGEAGPDVARSPGGDLELLSNQGATGRGGGGKWKHQGTATARTWLSRSQLFAAEGTAVGGHQDPIHRFTESCLKCGRRQILVQNPFYVRRFPLSDTYVPPGGSRECAATYVNHGRGLSLLPTREVQRPFIRSTTHAPGQTR